MMNRGTQPSYVRHGSSTMSLFRRQIVCTTNHQEPLPNHPTIYHHGLTGNLSRSFPYQPVTNSALGGDISGVINVSAANCWSVTTAGSLEPDPCLRTARPSSGLGSSGIGLEKKRKPDNSTEQMVTQGKAKENPKDKKKMKKKVSAEAYTANRKVVSKYEEDSKGCVHVRARPGRATDIHSIAERVKREKIRERTRYLESLVPGLDKTLGNAEAIEQIISYVLSLQQQVQFLNMKIAELNPNPDYSVDDFLADEALTELRQNNPCMTMPTSEVVNSGYDHLNPIQQAVPGTGTEFISSSQVAGTTDNLSWMPGPPFNEQWSNSLGV